MLVHTCFFEKNINDRQNVGSELQNRYSRISNIDSIKKENIYIVQTRNHFDGFGNTKIMTLMNADKIWKNTDNYSTKENKDLEPTKKETQWSNPTYHPQSFHDPTNKLFPK